MCCLQYFYSRVFDLGWQVRVCTSVFRFGTPCCMRSLELHCAGGRRTYFVHCVAQFFGQSEGETVMFGDKDSGKFGAYWVNDGKVVGAFLESGSNEENAAIKKLADNPPAAPSTEDLAKQGIEFAAKL